MVKFDYTPGGRIVAVTDTFSAFNEPGAPISGEVTTLTGITNEDVAGHKSDDAAVTSFVDDAVIVIAHNSGFDRRFAERYWPVFEHKALGCSMSEIDWRKHGFAGSQLGYPLHGAGFFRRALRAVDDPHALLEVLAFELPTTGSPALALLLEIARKPTMRVLGGADRVRAQGFAKAEGLSLERRKRRATQVLVHRCRRERMIFWGNDPALLLSAKSRVNVAAAVIDTTDFNPQLIFAPRRGNIAASVAEGPEDATIRQDDLIIEGAAPAGVRHQWGQPLSSM